MRYVDIILPLPLQDSYTYSIDDAMAVRCYPGVRLLVPFGKSKTYAAIALRVHDDKPELADDKIKTVYALLDNAPVLLPQQLKLWRWIASYYMSPLGDVMNAALPSGLKAQTEYRPKTETCVRLGEKFASEQGLRIATEMLRRMPKQLAAFNTYLNLASQESRTTDCGAGISPQSVVPPTSAAEVSALRSEPEVLPPGSAELRGEQEHLPPGSAALRGEITREELLNEAHCTTATVKKLVDGGFLQTYEREVGRLNVTAEAHPERIQQLSGEQEKAFKAIKEQWRSKNVVLLHGVTSSGKTEIYIHLIQKALDRGQQVLYLLPEIALTVQMTQRLQRVFGSRLGIYHSKYSDAERVEIWKKQLSAQPYDIILGARSAVFVPFQRLGLVIVDEEHETSFKQQDPAPRYHARSAAIVLATMYGAKTLLGTATPSMESYYNAKTGKYGLVALTHRFKDIQLPEIEVVDIKDLRHRKMMSGPFSPRLLAAMRESLSAGKQVILFQNRRGFAPVLSCPVCGWTPKCKNCDVTMTYHKRLGMLTCHYCGYTMPVPQVCPNCGNPRLSDRGYGTEKIEDLVRDNFPEARVARMDLDTTHTRGAYERLIGEFGDGKTNVLIGTQMISKGLDFDNVAVVGILDADTMLNYPDFRAYEQAFMMMSQVAGRAGRKGKRGLVILQTKSPNLPVVSQVVHNDYAAFYSDLLQERGMFHYPPFFHLIYVYLKHKSEGVVEMAAQEMGGLLRKNFSATVSRGMEAVDVLGPDKPAVARVKTLFIRKIVLKLPLGIDQKKTRQALYAVRGGILSQACYKSVQVYFDVDPL